MELGATLEMLMIQDKENSNAYANILNAQTELHTLRMEEFSLQRELLNEEFAL